MKELTKEIQELLLQLDVAVTNYVFGAYPDNKIDEEDPNVKLYRALGEFVND